MNNVYVLYGEDIYKKNSEIKNIIKKYDTDNVIKYDMATAYVKDIVIDATTISLLGDKKIIICDNSNFLSGAKKTSDEETEEEEVDQNYDDLYKYLRSTNEDTIIILNVPAVKLDERKKIVKELKTSAKLIECIKGTIRDASTLVKDTLLKSKYKITEGAINELIARTNSNLEMLDNELKKLMLYKLDSKEINIKDIEELVHKQIDDDIFALIDNLVNHNMEKSFEIYNELITKGEEPIKILVTLANQFRLIYKVKILSEMGLKESDIAVKLTIHPYRVKLAKEKIKQFTNKQLKTYLEQLADLDYKMKTNKIDKSLGLELFFLNI